MKMKLSIEYFQHEREALLQEKQRLISEGWAVVKELYFIESPSEEDYVCHFEKIKMKMKIDKIHYLE